MLGRYQEADSVFQEIYDESDALFLSNYGFNKHKLGKSEEGIKLIQKSIEIDSENSYAYRNLAIIEYDCGNEIKMCQYLIKAKDLNFLRYYGNEVDQMISKYCAGK